MAEEKREMHGTLAQIESLQQQLNAALKQAEVEKQMRKKQFSEASAKIAKAEEELAKSRLSPRSPTRPRPPKNDQSSTDAFLGCQMLRKTGKLILKDGQEFIGFSFGAERSVVVCRVDSAVLMAELDRTYYQQSFNSYFAAINMLSHC